MRNKYSIILGISLLLFSGNIAYGETSPKPEVQNGNIATEVKPLNTIIEGKAEFPNPKSELKISLILSQSYKSSKDQIISSTVSDLSGKFVLTFPPTFYPAFGEIFILEAKRKNSPEDNNYVSLRTYMQWNGIGWESITYPEIIINPKTTAFSIISDNNPEVLHPIDTIRKFQIINGETNFKFNKPLIKQNSIQEVTNLINISLSNNTDPSSEIKFQPEYYYLGSNTGYKEKVTFSGKVFNPSGIPVDRTIVTAKSIEPGINWVGQEQFTNQGSFSFKDAPLDAKILISVTKDGWTTRTRTEILKSNLSRDPNVNFFIFNGINSLQDEPEITDIKINGKKFTSTGPITKPVNINESTIINISKIDNSDIEIEISFSEPVKKEDVENNFRITSQAFTVKNNQNFIIDKNIPGISFNWDNDESKVKIKTNNVILSNISGNEARYMLDFVHPFRDRTNKNAINGKFIRFSSATSGDFSIFSVKNDLVDPKLISISAQDGKDSNDIITLTFNKSLEVINQISFPFILAPQDEPLNVEKQMMVTQTNNPNGNNSTLFGYGNTENITDFKAVYMIGKITNGTLKTEPLSGITNPLAVQKLNGILRNIKVNKDIVTIELSPDAFKKDDKIILSAGKAISTSFTDKTNPAATPILINVDSTGIIFSELKSPSGRLLSTGNETISDNFTVYDNQKITIVN